MESGAGSDDEAEDDDNPGGLGSDPAPAFFADQSVWKTPSAYIVHHLLKSLPPEKALTRDQVLFMMIFAHACDQVWEDETSGKPRHLRKVHHLLLLGQGGSGKTHVVQNLVFKAVRFIWPSPTASSDTLMVLAFSNAQANPRWLLKHEWTGCSCHDPASDP